MSQVMSESIQVSHVAVQELGESIPENSAHAVSVSLPSWRSNVGYEEGEDWVLSRMRNGYPRFFINLNIVSFQNDLLKAYGHPREQVLLFPSTIAAKRCTQFISQYSENKGTSAYTPCRILDLVPLPEDSKETQNADSQSVISAVFFDKDDTPVARKYWQHTGDGVSSRRAEFFHHVYKGGQLTPREVERPPSAGKTTSNNKGPRRYRREHRNSIDNNELVVPSPLALEDHELGGADSMKFVEERFGRNLDISLASKAKIAIRKRIAGSLTSKVDLESFNPCAAAEQFIRHVPGLTEDHVYLFSCGMNAIYTAHRVMTALKGGLKSIMFGFPYTDTLKVLEKFGPGALFYGNGASEDLDDLESRCESGERFQALFCEFPGNPLLRCPDLQRIRELADRFDFLVVVDETVGNFLNINVLPVADVVVSSLTKVFSGDANVMGGSLVLSPNRKYFKELEEIMQKVYVDYLWVEDSIFLERNSRDFIERNDRINANAEAIAELLHSSDKVKQVNYPKTSKDREFYDRFRNPEGGYSGLLSVTFYTENDAILFHDALATAKGPSLGTNFTLSSPFVILAHYNELEWVKSFGVDPSLIRVSIGLEPTLELTDIFKTALRAIE